MLCQSSQSISGTILIADDQASTRDLLGELLSAQGFRVVAVPDGAAALEQVSRIQADLVLPIIRYHHEHFDGSGYPHGLPGDQIPITARVWQTVNVYDALTPERPYKHDFSIADVLQTMKEEVARGWWDQRVFDQFEQGVGNGTANFLSRGIAIGH